MQAAPDGGALYQGRNDQLSVVLLAGSSDPAAAAASDARGSGVPGFVLLQGPHPVTMSGRPGILIEYRQSGGTNPRTGAGLFLNAVRLYVPRTGGGLYRIEYGVTTAAAQWDPRGAVDIVTTFRGGK